MPCLFCKYLCYFLYIQSPARAHTVNVSHDKCDWHQLGIWFAVYTVWIHDLFLKTWVNRHNVLTFYIIHCIYYIITLKEEFDRVIDTVKVSHDKCDWHQLGIWFAVYTVWILKGRVNRNNVLTFDIIHCALYLLHYYTQGRVW